MTKAAFFCVLTKMPYECQTWICMPVVMLLCCTINWSVTKRSRCVCSFICGGCNILKFCIPTKKTKKNIHFYRRWCCSFSQVCGFEPTPRKTCPRAVWLKWANYTAHFLWRWGPHSKVQVHSPSSNGASEREAAWEWGDAGNVSSCVFDKLLGAVGGSRRGRLWKVTCTEKPYLCPSINGARVVPHGRKGTGHMLENKSLQQWRQSSRRGGHKAQAKIHSSWLEIERQEESKIQGKKISLEF